MFKFKNFSSEEMGVVVEEITDILGKAAQRTLVTEVIGYDGAREVPMGYERINRSLTLILMKPEKLDEVLSWLNGYGVLEYQGRKTHASFYNSIEPERFSSKIKIECKFLRDPLWFEDNDFETTINEVINRGNVPSAPLIKLIKGAETSCELSIAGVRFKYNFGSDSSVLIDCKEKNATFNGFRRNRQLEIDFEFPILQPGTNRIIVHTGSPTIQFKYKDVYL